MGYTEKEVDRQKRWTKHGVNKLLKTLRRSRAQLTGGQKIEFFILKGSVATRLRRGG